MVDCIKGLIACIFLATAVCGPAAAQMTYNPCLRPGPNGEAVWLPGCEFEGRPMPRGYNGGAIETDYWRKPRPAMENERCVRMTRHRYASRNAQEEDYESFAKNTRKKGFRFERRKDGGMVVYVPVLSVGPPVGDIEFGMARAGGKGFAYRGWEYAAVSGCY